MEFYGLVFVIVFCGVSIVTGGPIPSLTQPSQPDVSEPDRSADDGDFPSYDYSDMVFPEYMDGKMDVFEIRSYIGKCPTMDWCSFLDWSLECPYEDREPSYFRSYVDNGMCRGCMKCKDHTGKPEGEQGNGNRNENGQNQQNDGTSSGVRTSTEGASTTTTTTVPSTTEPSTTTTARSNEPASPSSARSTQPSTDRSTGTTTTSTTSSTTTTTTTSTPTTTTVTTTTKKANKKSKPDLEINQPSFSKLGHITFPNFPKSGARWIGDSDRSLMLSEFNINKPNSNEGEGEEKNPDDKMDPDCPMLDCMDVEAALLERCEPEDMVPDMMYVRVGTGMIECEGCRKCKDQR